jgi:hypothetical protein
MNMSEKYSCASQDAREEVATLERELADVRRAKMALAPEEREELGAPIALPGNDHHFVPVVRAKAADVFAHYSRSPYEKLTMKELVLKALTEVFPGGATANQLLHHLRTRGVGTT